MSTEDVFEDDLRQRFDGALEGVRPSPELYRRVGARVDRRGSSRLLAGVAVALVVAAGVVAVNVMGPSPERLRIDPVAPPSDEPVDVRSDEPTDEASGHAAPVASEPDASEPPTVEGEPYEGPPIVAGAGMAVIGVDADDVLNVRAAPGADNDVVATLAPLADGVVATGQGRSLDGAVWIEVTAGDVTGWVHAAFVAHTAGTADITAQVVEAHGGLPSAGSLAELAEIVAGHRATQEPPSRVVISDGPHVGDLGEVTVDVVGFGDDSVRAERLVVFATIDGDGSFTLRSVEATTYCGRGVTDGELCV